MCEWFTKEVIIMFEFAGKIGDYTRMQNLKQSAQIKISTGVSVDLNKGDMGIKYASADTKTSFFDKMVASARTNKKKIDQARTASIKDKLKRGKKLSATEMKYLKDTDENLYRKAKTVQEARAQLERELKQAKTKQEARLARVRAAMRVSSQAAAANSGASAGTAMPTGGESGVAAQGNVSGAVSANAGAVSGEAGAIKGEDGAASMAAGADGRSDAASSPVVSGDAAAQGAADSTDKVQQGQAEAMDSKATNSEKAAEENKAAVKSLNMMMEQNAEIDDFDFTPTEFLIMRALNDAWKSFTKSKTFEEMPEDELELAREPIEEKAKREARKKKASPAPDYVIATKAYQSAMDLRYNTAL